MKGVILRVMPVAFCFMAAFGFAFWLFQTAAAAQEEKPACRALEFREAQYTVCTFYPAWVDLRLFHTNQTGMVYGSFDALTRDLWRNHGFLDFAMNGGMYHDDLLPVGLFIENGVEKRPLVQSEGYGNFHLLPNGVFYFGEGKAGVMETEAYARSGLKPRFATQSGPMLVIDNRLHPRFLPDGDSLKIRNGVGVDSRGYVHFAISESRVRFYDFALLFRDVLGSPNALYLDGTISSVLIPRFGRNDRLFPMGPIIGVVAHLPE